MLVALVVLLHEAVEPLRVVPWQLMGIAVQKGIELPHQHIEIPTRTFSTDGLIDFGVKSVLSAPSPSS